MIADRRGPITAARFSLISVCMLAFSLGLFLNASAQDEWAYKELEGAKKKAHALLEKAEALEKAGRHDKAEACRKKAEDLMAKIEASHARPEERIHEEERFHEEEGIHEEGWEHGRRDRLEETLHGLNIAMEGLEAMERHDALELLREMADGLREEMDATGEERLFWEEREAAVQRLEVMRSAMPALREAGRPDSAELVRRAVRACEMDLEGRDDYEAEIIRAAAPDLGAQVELLSWSAKLWDEFGHEAKAARLQELSEELMARHREERREGWFVPETDEERERAERGLKIMRYAVEGFLEAEMMDMVELLENAMHAWKLAMAGRDDQEARRIRAIAVRPELVVDILVLGEEVLREQGRTEQAAAVSALTEKLAERLGLHREPEMYVEDALLHEIEVLNERCRHLEDALNGVREELHLMKQRAR